MIANVRPFPRGSALPSRLLSPRVWAVVLAGRPLRHGAASLCQAIERAARLVPSDRVVSVLCRETARDYAPALADLPDATRLVQPLYRGSAAETFLAVLTVARRDPDSVVVAFVPGRGTDEDRVLPPFRKAVRAVTLRPELVVVVGGQPQSARLDDGWIEPGSPVAGLEDLSVRAIRRFVASPAQAPDVVSPVALVARARTLIALGRRFIPDVLETLEPLEAAADSPEARLLCEAVYEYMPYASLWRELLQRAADVTVVPVPRAIGCTDHLDLVQLAS